MVAIGVSSDNIKGALAYGTGGTQYRHPLPISANGHQRNPINNVISISLSFYSEFSKVLDQRILLHLKSIKTLKRIQLQRLIEKEWSTFTYDNTEKENIFFKIPKDKFLKNGIYDLTHLHPENETSIGNDWVY